MLFWFGNVIPSPPNSISKRHGEFKGWFVEGEKLLACQDCPEMDSALPLTHRQTDIWLFVKPLRSQKVLDKPTVFYQTVATFPLNLTF